jgi:murein DD-endopeptidase MepM/ murein hydrolase activator NlpD
VVVAALLMLASDTARPTWAGAQAPPDTSSPREEYDDVLASEVALVDQLDAAARRVDELEAETAELDRRVAQAHADLAGAEASLERATAADERAEAEAAAAEERLEEAIEELREHAVASYIRGGRAATDVEALISAMQDVENAATTLTYADAVVDHQRALVDEATAARAERDAKAADARTARAEALKTRDLVDQARADVEAERSAKADLAEEARVEEAAYGRLLYELQGVKAAIRMRIAAQEAESARIAAALALQQAAQLATQQAAASPPPTGPTAPQTERRSGAVTFVDPLPGYATGSPYGWRRHPILGYQRLHTGVDIPAPSGTPIRAAADGMVLSAGPRGGYGNTVIIDHGSSMATLYAHQSDINVAPGQTVQAGDVIGEVGSTGLSTGPHLHLEVRIGGTPVDPLGYIPR